jgi:hypothetical protein
VTTFTDDFTNPTTSAANWATTFQGTTGGTQQYVSNTSLLTPKTSAINSVSQRHTGTFTDVSATVALSATTSINYFCMTLGSGAVATIDNSVGNWWYTSLQTGYMLALVSNNTLRLYRCNGAGVAATTLTSGTFSPVVTVGASNTFELTISGGVVYAYANGSLVCSANDATYTAGGDILIAQGRYTSNAGATTAISLVNATGAGSSGITGTLNATQAANTLASGAAVAVHGTLSKTQAAGSVSASGTLHVTGSLARTQGANALAASGHVATGATLAKTQAGNTLAATGTTTSTGIVGSLSATQAAQSLASTGHVKVSGALNSSQSGQTVVAHGAAAIHGALSANQAAQSLVARGSTENAIAGELNVTQASQTVSASGHVAIHGGLSVTQNNNALAALGAAVIRGALAGTQAANTLQASGSAPRQPITGQLAVTQAAQTLQAFGETTAFFIASGRLVLLSPENRTVLLPAEPRTILLEA